MVMTAQEARDKVDAGRLHQLMDLIESSISVAVYDLKDQTQVAIAGGYKSCITQAINELNDLGYITLCDYEETSTLTIIW